MKRLTNKDKIKELSTFQNNNVLMTDNDYKELKLGMLEDIEEKIGIDLLTLCKHRTLAEIVRYVWYKTEHPKCHKEVIIKREVDHFHDNGMMSVHSYDTDYVCFLRIKDYGKDWALTKEELKR